MTGAIVNTALYDHCRRVVDAFVKVPRRRKLMLRPHQCSIGR
jgi:hypothetical protein